MQLVRFKFAVGQLPTITGWLSLLLGLVVMMGWHSEQAALVQILPQFVPMQYNTALGFVLCGLALILLNWKLGGPSAALSIAGILVGILTGLQYLAGTDFGIDQFFMSHYITTETSHPGRMAPNTAISFALTGAGLLAAALMSHSDRRRWVAGVVGSIVLGLGLVAVSGYAAGLSPAYGWGLLTPMALHTAVGFSMLGVGLISIAWQDALTKESLEDKPSAWWPASAGIFVISFSVLIASALETHEAGLVGQVSGSSDAFAPSVALAFGIIMGILLGTTLWLNRRSRLQAIVAGKLAKRLVKEKAATKASEDRSRKVFNTIGTGTMVIGTNGKIRVFNPAAEEIFGYKADEIVGKNVSKLMPEPDRQQHDGYIRNYIETGEAKIICIGRQVSGLRKNGDVFPLQLEVGEMKVGGDTCFVGSIADLTELQSLESQFRQAQKLEAVGQLTGGVAHDFNNLLAIIQGNLSLLESDIDDGRDMSAEELRESIEPALQASKRGAELTQRLLAFSRKQALQPQILCLNNLVSGMEDMLRRTLGETIDLKMILKKGDWLALVDPSQLESALLNLALNARDAMQYGGSLTVETEDVTLDQTYVATHPGASIGEFIMLAVSDTGTGMTPEVMDKVFDPFFTTKGVGKGSGLGLSMVHGFVKQSGGNISIYSEPGEGTSLKLYLPRSLDKEDHVTAPRLTSPEGGHETILVVEDDADVRNITVRILGRLGYRVMEAEDGQTALTIFEKEGHVDLLLSDVVLPGGMSGPDVAKAAQDKAPGLKILYMSGYTENAIVHHGRVDQGSHLIGKPFSHADLSTKVREVLDAVD